MLTRAIETYVHPDFEQHTLVDFSMQDSVAVDNWSHWTPKPVQKNGKVVEGTETEGGNSQVESEDSNFETPRALKRGTDLSAPSISTDNDSDTVEIVDQERVSASEYQESQLDNQQQQSESESDSDKNVQNLKGLKRIDLTKLPKNANGKGKGKDKQAFRKDVKERQALVAKQGKNQVR